MAAIITKASSTKALVITRSLGRKSVDVTTSDSFRFATSFFSKYSKKHFIYPSPKKNPKGFIQFLVNYVRKSDEEVLIPIHSDETYLIAKHKKGLEAYIKVPLPDYEKIRLVNDKSSLSKYAESLNIPIPRTYYLQSLEELTKVGNILECPVVIKLRETTSSKGLSYAYNENELISMYKMTVKTFNLRKHNLPIIQEYIPGDGYGVEMLFNQGDLRAKFTHKRLREYPITGGPSTLRVSVRHPKMEEYAVSLLKSLNWHGVVMAEFKLHSKTKKPYLIEINPRFWGSINQAIMSGVDFPYLLYTMAVDGDVKPVLSYKVGVVTRFLLNDLRAFPSYFRRSHHKLKLLKDYLSFKNKYYDDISIEDPIPTLMLTLNNIRRFK